MNEEKYTFPQLMKILWDKRFQFRDEGGNLCGFKWWRRWKIAKWHWIKWLRYEGMPEWENNTDDLIWWSKKIYEKDCPHYWIDMNGRKQSYAIRDNSATKMKCFKCGKSGF